MPFRSIRWFWGGWSEALHILGMKPIASIDCDSTVVRVLQKKYGYPVLQPNEFLRKALP